MSSISQENFPGVYATVRDGSFFTTVSSRFTAGLVGVTNKGPMNVATPTRSLKEFRRLFGTSVDNQFVAQTASILTNQSDGVLVVRVGSQYANRASSGVVSGLVGADAYKIYTADAKLLNIGDYIRVTQGGKISTVNVQVTGYIDSAGASTSVTADIAGVEVSNGTGSGSFVEAYTDGVIDSSTVANAANNAEGFLEAYRYSTAMGPLGTITGNKNDFKFQVDVLGTATLGGAVTSIVQSGTSSTVDATAHGYVVGNVVTLTGAAQTKFNGDFYVASVIDANSFTITMSDSASASASPAAGMTLKHAAIAVGDILKIDQSTKTTSLEVKVKEVRLDGVIVLERTNQSASGFQAVPLADTYTAGNVYRLRKNTDGSPMTCTILQLIAATPGTWANSDGVSTGLIVKVAPGSKPGTKKLLVYENSGLVETIDNLSTDSSSTDYYPTRINDLSAYIAIPTDSTGAVIGVLDHTDSSVFEQPANTTKPWTTTDSVVNFVAFGNTAKVWGLGYNGENVTDADIIGTIGSENIDDSVDSATGLHIFEDTDNIDVYFIYVPGNTSLAVRQELALIAQKINCLAVSDVPDNLNGRAAVDWHNGAGFYSSQLRIDNPFLTTFWNWFQIIDPFNKTLLYMPPGAGALRCWANVFDNAKPWRIAAGENYGILPEALSVRFPRISKDVKEQMQAPGNSINPIIKSNGRIMVFGDKTMQIAASKLSEAHNIVLTCFILKNLSKIARRHVFDPNDAELLRELKNEFDAFLKGVKNERGIEDYNLQIDDKNNTEDIRNNRAAVVDFDYVPVSGATRIFINATARESGAVLNSLS